MKQSDATRNAALLVLLVVALAILLAVLRHRETFGVPAAPSTQAGRGSPGGHTGAR